MISRGLYIGAIVDEFATICVPNWICSTTTILRL